MRNKRHEAAFSSVQSKDVYQVVFGRKKRQVPTFLSPDADAETLRGLEESRRLGMYWRLKLLKDRYRSELRLQQATSMLMRETRPELVAEPSARPAHARHARAPHHVDPQDLRHVRTRLLPARH